jgi:hypothetical protein
MKTIAKAYGMFLLGGILGVLGYGLYQQCSGPLLSKSAFAENVLFDCQVFIVLAAGPFIATLLLAYFTRRRSQLVTLSFLCGAMFFVFERLADGLHRLMAKSTAQQQEQTAEYMGYALYFVVPAVLQYFLVFWLLGELWAALYSRRALRDDSPRTGK